MNCGILKSSLLCKHQYYAKIKNTKSNQINSNEKKNEYGLPCFMWILLKKF